MPLHLHLVPKLRKMSNLTFDFLFSRYDGRIVTEELMVGRQ